MLKRKLFFWLERLKITRAERRSVITLMIILLSLIFVNALIESSAPYGPDSYTKIEKAFKKRSALLKQQNKKIMAAYRGIPASAAAADSLPSPHPTSGTPININTAKIELLKTLPGIGPAYAQNIIDYRNKNGFYTSKAQLLKVEGIGDARFAKIKPLIVLGKVKKTAMISEESEKTTASSTNKEPGATEVKLINVNTADAKALATLPGIGDAYAQNIIEYRRKNGLFTAFKQLLKVDGIGKKRLEKLVPFIKLTDESE